METENKRILDNQLSDDNSTNKSKKKLIGNVLLLLINVILVAFIVITYLKDNNSITFADFKGIKINYMYLGLCFPLLVSVLLLDSFKYYRLIYSFSKVKSIRVSYLTNVYGKYYDYVTPFGSGGQPFQMYFLHKSNVDGDASVSVPMCRFIFNHIGLLIFFLVSLIYCLVTNSIDFNMVFIVSVIAFIGNVIFLGAIVFVSLKKDIAYKISVVFIKLMTKLHIIKDFDKTCNKVDEILTKYQYNLKRMYSNKKEFIILLLSSIATIILNYTFVYFIYLVFASNYENRVGYMNIVSSMVICEMISSVMPLPGGTGAAEFSFISLFNNWFTFSNGKNIVVWAMLIWRIFTYYYYIVQGLVVTIKDVISGGIKKDKKFIKKSVAIENKNQATI